MPSLEDVPDDVVQWLARSPTRKALTDVAMGGRVIGQTGVLAHMRRRFSRSQPEQS